MAGQFTLFDIPSKAPSSTWTPNPWKTRFLLNFKGLDYKTEWLEYPEIKPRLEAHIPNPPNGAYTIPTVEFPDGSYIMDSRQIVEAIEKAHPEPSVHLDSPVLHKLEALMNDVMGALAPIYIVSIPKVLLNPSAIPYWIETREKFVGMSLQQLDEKRGGQQAWDAAKPFIQQVEALLKENQEGPFFLGKTVSYADFIWAGFILFIQRNGFLEDLYNVCGDSQLHKDLIEATEPWHKRNNY
ncbi:hypothetical protein BGZ63DRAFT_345739 [Mariannaea sp. PMI_226]|nr:hypothetical protein BGZ63DRAFT_345739 [Mariannaea sp. PMI_226]